MMFRLSTTCFYISFEVWDRKTEKKNVFMTQESQFVICNPTFCLQNFFLKLDLWNQFILLSPCSPPLPHVHNIHDIELTVSFLPQYCYWKQMAKAATLIQNKYRLYCEHKRHKKSQQAATCIQNYYRNYKEHQQRQTGSKESTPTTGIKWVADYLCRASNEQSCIIAEKAPTRAFDCK